MEGNVLPKDWLPEKPTFTHRVVSQIAEGLAKQIQGTSAEGFERLKEGFLQALSHIGKLLSLGGDLRRSESSTKSIQVMDFLRGIQTTSANFPKEVSFPLLNDEHDRLDNPYLTFRFDTELVGAAILSLLANNKPEVNTSISVKEDSRNHLVFELEGYEGKTKDTAWFPDLQLALSPERISCRRKDEKVTISLPATRKFTPPKFDRLPDQILLVDPFKNTQEWALSSEEPRLQDRLQDMGLEETLIKYFKTADELEAYLDGEGKDKNSLVLGFERPDHQIQEELVSKVGKLDNVKLIFLFDPKNQDWRQEQTGQDVNEFGPNVIGLLKDDSFSPASRRSFNVNASMKQLERFLQLYERSFPAEAASGAS